MSRVDIRAVLADAAKRRALCVQVIVSTQAVAGITTTSAQAEAAYAAVTRPPEEYPREPTPL